MDFEKHQRMIDTQLDYRLGALIKDECYTHTDIYEEGYYFTRHIHTISELEILKLKALVLDPTIPDRVTMVINEILKGN
jgi:hypothetical protein